MRLVVVEDDPSIAQSLRDGLERRGFEVVEAATGAAGLELAADADFVLLDLGLPDMDGKTIIMQTRQTSDTPIIVLSAREQEAEKIAALDLGANDYVAKPFGIAELLARVRAALRPRRGPAADAPLLRIGEVTIDVPAHRVTRGAEPVVDLNGADVQADAIEYRNVKVRGQFVRDWPLYLDNRPYQGRAGFYLLMPMKIAGSNRAVLVGRGWFPRDIHDRAKVPDIVTPSGTIELQGSARRNIGRLFQLGSPPPPSAKAIVQNAEIAEVAAASNLNLLPVFIEQTSDTGDGLVRDWPLPSSGVAMHRGYAVQWYGLAATALIFFLVTGCRRGRKQQ